MLRGSKLDTFSKTQSTWVGGSLLYSTVSRTSSIDARNQPMERVGAPSEHDRRSYGVPERGTCQDGYQGDQNGGSVADRARAILGTMKEQRETLSDVMERRGSSRNGYDKTAIKSRRFVGRYEQDEQSVDTSIPSILSGGDVTQQITKALQERRERLERILAGLDPDDQRGNGGASVSCCNGTFGDLRSEMGETRSTALSTTMSSTVHQSPQASPRPTVFRRFEGEVLRFVSKPPTLEDIHEAFDSNPPGAPDELSHVSSMSEEGDQSGENDSQLDGFETTEERIPSCPEISQAEASSTHSSCILSPESCHSSTDDITPELEHTGFSATSSDSSYELGFSRRAYSFDESTMAGSKAGPSLKSAYSFDKLYDKSFNSSYSLSPRNEVATQTMVLSPTDKNRNEQTDQVPSPKSSKAENIHVVVEEASEGQLSVGAASNLSPASSWTVDDDRLASNDVAELPGKPSNAQALLSKQNEEKKLPSKPSPIKAVPNTSNLELHSPEERPSQLSQQVKESEPDEARPNVPVGDARKEPNEVITEEAQAQTEASSSKKTKKKKKSIKKDSEKSGPGLGQVKQVYSFDDTIPSVKPSPLTSELNRSQSFDIVHPTATRAVTVNELKLPAFVGWSSKPIEKPTFADHGWPREVHTRPESPASTLTTPFHEDYRPYFRDVRPGEGFKNTLEDVDEQDPGQNLKNEIFGTPVVQSVEHSRKQPSGPHEVKVKMNSKSPTKAKTSLSKGSSPRSSTTSSTDDYASVLFSDDSSFDFSQDSSSSGWISSSDSASHGTLLHLQTDDDMTEVSILVAPKQLGEDAQSVDLFDELLEIPPEIFKRNQNHKTSEKGGILLKKSSKRTNGTKERSGTEKRVAFAEEKDKVQSKIVKAKRKPPLLFVSEERADALSKSNSSLYSLALSSGLDLTKPMEINIVPREPVVKMLRLNSDFRCGTRGSLYDIALRSGFDLKTSWDWAQNKRRRSRFLATHGGLFEVATRSGLSTEKIHSRTSFVVQTKPKYLLKDEEDEVILPEEITDYECGTTGSLYLAFESAGGDYVTKGSLYYLASRSGMTQGGRAVNTSVTTATTIMTSQTRIQSQTFPENNPQPLSID